MTMHIILKTTSNIFKIIYKKNKIKKNNDKLLKLYVKLSSLLKLISPMTLHLVFVFI